MARKKTGKCYIYLFSIFLLSVCVQIMNMRGIMHIFTFHIIIYLDFIVSYVKAVKIRRSNGEELIYTVIHMHIYIYIYIVRS